MKIGYFLSGEEWGPGDHARIYDLPASHRRSASELVTEEMLAAEIPCGNDVERHLEAIRAYAEAGFDELYSNQIGPDQDAFFKAYSEQVLQRLR